jgi:hypothetical protein
MTSADARERRARYWMTNLAVLKRTSAMREYIGKINREDIKFLRAAPHSAEAIEGLRKLSREAAELAFKLADSERHIRERHRRRCFGPM